MSLPQENALLFETRRSRILLHPSASVDFDGEGTPRRSKSAISVGQKDSDSDTSSQCSDLPWNYVSTIAASKEDEESSVYKVELDQDSAQYDIQKLVTRTHPDLVLTSKAQYMINAFIDSMATVLLDNLATDATSGTIDSQQVATAIKSTLHKTNEADIQVEPSMKYKSLAISQYFSILDRTISEFDGFINTSEDSWRFLRSVHGVQAYRWTSQHHPNSDVRLLKGVGVIHASAEDVKEKLISFGTMNWDPLFESARVLEQIDNRTIIWHLRYAARKCLLKRTRDFVVMGHWFEKPDGSYVCIGRSVEHPRCPVSDGCVRGQILTMGYHVRPLVRFR
eukprot:TRINITY_DN5263_c0_g1_i2.p1 TRINITY_DN5263_c0_g1~~TRINITY_DN5263_c0_g1_i2.p1  ORF type:complete len:337 (+),score=48.84 TRINITY_DN5263_c0_g1_i2:99-1109(+)